MKKSNRLLFSHSVTAIFILTTAYSTFGLGNIPRRVLPSQIPPIAANLRATALLAPSTELTLAITLPLRSEAELDAFLKQVYDPASPNFRHFLTPEMFADNFGPTVADYQAVVDFAEKNGFRVTRRHPNRLVLDVVAPVSAIEQTFQIKMRTYQHPLEQRTFFAPDSNPSVDMSAPINISGISGLDNYFLPHPANLHSTTPPPTASPNAGSGPGGTYVGRDFRLAYLPGNNPLNGAGQSVALLQFDGYYSNDITAYQTLASLPPVSLVNIPVNGGVSTPGSGGIEVSLDIEMVISMVTNLSHVYVYEAPNPTPWVTILSQIANDNLAQQISCSWGGGSANPNSQAEVIFKQMATQGQSFFCASGDSDAYVGGAVFPDDSPNITMVGGTTLTTASRGGTRVSETAWNDGAGTGSGGGISTIYAIPFWQQALNPFLTNGGSAVARNVPDVAMTADNIYVKYGNGQGTSVVGTSCASPLWAGFMAMVNQKAAANGLPPVGFINPSVYEIANESIYASTFNDITTGNNTSTTSPNSFFAVPGYDLCTGFGTPKGTNLINALAIPDPLVVVTNNGFNAVGTAAGTFNISSQTFSLTNASNASLSWSVINTSTWLNVSTSSGILPVGGTANVTVSLNAVGSNLVAGTYLTGVSFSNITSHVGHSRFFTLKTTDPLVILPATKFFFAGLPGGPFTPASQGITLTNPSANTFNWGINNTSSWINLAPTSGSLAPGGQASLVLTLSPTAANLPDGFYTANILTTNLTSHVVQVITANLAAGIVQNGGFESGDFTSWVLVGNTSVGGSLYDGVVDVNALTDGSGPSFIHSGSYGVFLGDTNVATLSQSLQTTPGQSYVLSFWFTNPTNGAGQQFSVSWNTNSPAVNQIFSIVNPPAFGWSNYTFMVQATGTNTTLQFGAANPPNGFGLDDVSLIAILPPTVTSQPTNLTILAGNTAVFSATVTGSLPRSYQWNKNGVALTNGSGISGATAAALTLTSVTSNSAANYSLVVTNAYGSATSSVATLTVLLPPTITTALTNQTIQCGGNAAFAISATGTPPLSYQWILDGSPVFGATNNSLALTNIHLPNHPISIIVTDLYSSVTNSAIVAVVDTLAPVIALIGANPIYVELGGTFIDPGATANDVCAGAVAVVTNGTVNLNVVGTNLLTYVSTDGNGNTNLVTRAIIVRDTTPPSITGSFTNLVLAANTNCSAPMPDVTGTNFIRASDLSGALTIAQNPTNNAVLLLGTNLVVITVADTSGNATFSTNTITVQDQTPPVILTQPQSRTNLVGTPAVFSVVATACTQITYQWLSNNIVLANQTNATLTLAPISAAAAANYSVAISSFGGNATSAVAVLTVSLGVGPTITSVSANPDGSFNLNLAGSAGSTYILDATTNLIPPIGWLPVATNTLGTNGIWLFTDTNAVNFMRQFYRLKLKQ